MSPLRVLRGFIFGALGGALGWMLVEFLPLPYPFQPARFEAPGAMPPEVSPHMEALLGLALGLAIGGFLGMSEGLSEGTMGRFKRAFWTFILLGPLGGYVGLYFGQYLYAALGGSGGANVTLQDFFPQLFARSMGWMLLGLLLGACMGVPGLSTRRMWNGAVGGAIGGFLGGFVFQTLAFSGLAQGIHGRMVGFTVLGAAIGFFINLVAEAMKRVWVKVLVGRGEGREHVLDTPLAYVGRDELAEVPVFLDPMVPKRMASFRLNGGRYSLYPESAGLPIVVNGQPLTPGQLLRDGDAIQFGRVTLGYYEKATATGTQRPVDTVALADFRPGGTGQMPGSVAIPRDPGVCEFCAQPRDPITGACACAVPAAAPYGPQDAYAAQPGYPPPDIGSGYAPPADYGAPAYGPAAYDPGGYAPPAAVPGYGDPGAAYAPTMMDPGQAGAYAGAGGPRLTAVDGAYAGQVFPLGGAEITVGRDPSQTIALTNDGTASRMHARFSAANGGWMVTDAGSSNGTWVNGVRVQQQPLFPGDMIRIGGTQFRFEV